MIFLIAFLLLAEGATREVSCRSSGIDASVKIVDESLGKFYGNDGNFIRDSIRNAKPSIERFKRDSEFSTSTTEATRAVAYEKAINQTISDYHAQRKAVMDRYYARQREIVEKFSRKTAKPEKTFAFVTTVRPTTERIILEKFAKTTEVDGKKDGKNYEIDLGTREKSAGTSLNLLSDERGNDETRGKNNSSGSWMYRSSNWNPKVSDGDSDIDLQPESSIAFERSVDRRDRPAGYYKLGDFKGSKDEKVVYQHNLGVGVKGPSQLDATFEAVIEGPYEITTVEAFPYANSRANFTWLGGGPGTDFVKLKLRGYENEGFSYSVKVWGVPRQPSR